jgi:ubiquinone/menaquinone biosynthesis C-methylase UbiE
MNRLQEPPSKRTLDEDIPELKQYLKPGAKVLDVGCGFGTITLGVADIVDPGEVVGIDPGKDRVDVALEWSGQVTHPGNITFQVGDSHHLDFPDDTFDVVYSHTVLHFFLDPVMGLKEQKRVSKKGGWVIASGVRDHVDLRHPSCPHWENLYEAYRKYWVACLEEYRASRKDPAKFIEEKYKSALSWLFYYDIHAGRKCPEWFHKAGLEDIRIEIQPRRVKYQGPNGMEPDALDFVVFDEPESELQRQDVSDQQRMISEGLLDEETLERATDEARAWYKDPDAFQFFPEVFAAARST